MDLDRAIEQITSLLTPSLLKPAYRRLVSEDNPLLGHCYHASEALYYLLGGREAGWVPKVYREDNGLTHWWLQNEQTGEIADPTADQYQGRPLPYTRGLGRGCGWLTKEPSRPAQIILDQIDRA